MSMKPTPRRAASRRGFLQCVKRAVIAFLTLRWLPLQGVPGGKTGNAVGGRPAARWGMVIDLDLCTGCGACVVACRSENNVPITGMGRDRKGTGIYWMDLLERHRGHDRRSEQEILPVPCMHCDNPPCVKVCPVGATYQNEEGITAQIWDRCIGCRFCQTVCPYARRSFNWTKPRWPESYRNYINPDVATRPKGVIEKCTFCYHRIRRLKEHARMDDRRPLDSELQRLPACAQACPAHAIVFGDLHDEKSLVHALSRTPRVFRLLEHLGTSPKVYYLTKDRRSHP